VEKNDENLRWDEEVTMPGCGGVQPRISPAHYEGY
jgi:hypothetical protein